MTDLQPVVVGLDFSEGSEAALVRAADLAERLHTRLHLLHASPTVPVALCEAQSGGALERRVRDFAGQTLGGPRVFDVLGPEVVVRRGETAADALVRYVEEVGAGLLVLGTHGKRGVRRMLMGSVAEEVVRRASCSVLTVPTKATRTAPGPEAPVLVPTDFSEPSRGALAAAKTIAVLFEAPVELLHVVEGRPYPDFYRNIPGLLTTYDTVPTSDARLDRERIEPYLRRFDEETGGEPAARTHVRAGHPDREITDLAEQTGAGLVVMATHGRSGLEHSLVGSVTERTLRRVSCPVLSLHVSAKKRADTADHRERAVRPEPA